MKATKEVNYKTFFTRKKKHVMIPAEKKDKSSGDNAANE